MYQTRVGAVENCGLNLEIDLTDFAHGVDGETEWETGVADDAEDADLSSCRATSDVPLDQEEQSGGEAGGQVWGGIRGDGRWSS